METLRNKENTIPELCNKKYRIKDEEPKIAVIGDMHLHHSTPASRIDNYPETCCQKLSILRRELVTRGIKYLICAGDIFHIPKERTDFEFSIISELLKFKKSGIQFFVINGNHDIPSDRLDNISKTSLGICYLTESINPFTEIVFEREDRDIVITGTPFPNDIEPVKEFESYNINVCHKFYEVSTDQNSLMKKDLTKLGYNLYICGHDHVVYPLEKETTTEGIVYIIRPGSFMRGTAHKYNTTRMVYMDVLDFSKKVREKGKQIEIERVTLPVKDPREIFSATVVDKGQDRDLKDISQELANLVDRLYSQDVAETSVYDVLDNSVIDAQIKDRIVQYLELYGIYRKQ